MSDYKINPESVPKITKIDYLTDADVISESKVTLEELLMQSYKHALNEGIKANTVILDEHFCKVNGFAFCIGNNGMGYGSLPPMICGMEIRGVSKGELPAGYDFAVFEAPMTEREALIWDTKRSVIRQIWRELNDALICVDDIRAVEDVVIDRIMNKMLKELNGCDNPTDESGGV